MHAYLNGVVVRLARLCVRPVRHEPCLQQVLVEAVPQSSHRRVVCRQKTGWASVQTEED